MRKGDNTEHLILKAAEEEFMDKGFVLAKTTDIARRAGVTHAMLHYYFRTKEKLFEQVFREKVTLLARSLVPTFDGEKPFLQWVADFTGAHFDFVAAHPQLPSFVLHEISQNECWRNICLPVMRDALQATVRSVESLLSRAVERGEVTPVRVENLLYSIISMNIMTFVVAPVMKAVYGWTEEDLRLFVRQRRKENIEMIIRRLKKQA